MLRAGRYRQHGDVDNDPVGGTIASTGGNFVPVGNPLISPDGHYLYIPGTTSNGAALSVFDTNTGTIGSPISLNSVPLTYDQLLATSPNGQYLYAGGAQNSGALTIIDTVNAAISDPISVNTHGYLGGIAATGSNGYVTDQYSSQVAIINPTLATYHSLASGTGFTGSGTPVVVPPPTPDPGTTPTGSSPTGPFPYPNLSTIPGFNDLNNITSIYGVDLSHALDPVTNAVNDIYKFGNDAWAVGNALLGNGSFGPLAVVSAVSDAHSLGADLANGNWGSAAIDGVSVVADVARIFL